MGIFTCHVPGIKRVNDTHIAEIMDKCEAVLPMCEYVRVIRYVVTKSSVMTRAARRQVEGHAIESACKDSIRHMAKQQ